MIDELEQDQIDCVALLQADDSFAAVTVLQESKGDIESDIAQVLSTLNEKAGKTGACAVVLQPTESPSNIDTPNPEVRARLTIQVFDQPLLNTSDNGTGKDVWQLARRVRQLLHRRSFGTGVYSWIGTDDAPQADASRRSRIVVIEKRTQEESFTRLGPPLIEPEDGGPVPQNVTITPPAGADAWYTLDGTLPTPGNEAAVKYTAPIDVEQACTLRVAAYLDGSIPSSTASADFT